MKICIGKIGEEPAVIEAQPRAVPFGEGAFFYSIEADGVVVTCMIPTGEISMLYKSYLGETIS